MVSGDPHYPQLSAKKCLYKVEKGFIKVKKMTNAFLFCVPLQAKLGGKWKQNNYARENILIIGFRPIYPTSINKFITDLYKV